MGGEFRSWMRPLAVLASALPAVALLSCVAIAVRYHAEHTLTTHCRNVNRLPSISAAVGQRSPEKRIWSVSIAVSCAIRLLVAAAYRQEIAARLPAIWRVSGSSAATAGLIPAAHFGLGCLELASLLGLSVVSSSDNYAIHRNCFVTFLLSSFAYMLLHLCIAAQIRSNCLPGTQRALFTTRCFLAKLMSLSAYCASILLAVYFYARHQAYCEDMMYTYFAAAEYAVVYANILFHFTAYYDLGRVPIGLVFAREFKLLADCKAASFAGKSCSMLLPIYPKDSADPYSLNSQHWKYSQFKMFADSLQLAGQSWHTRQAAVSFDAEPPVSAVTHSLFAGL